MSAGICEQQGYEYAVATYHFAMAVAHAANAETLQYHQKDASEAVQGAQLHMSKLQVCSHLMEVHVQTFLSPQ